MNTRAVTNGKPFRDWHREIELLPVHLQEEAYPRLFFTMLKRWRTAG
jgi:hypothetical protein